MDIANFFLGRQGEDQKQLKQIRGAGPAPSARESHSCTWLGSQLYIFGGYDGSRVLNDLYAYDINNAMWKQIVHSGISPPARAGHSGTALGVPPHLVIFGGANASRRFNDVSILDTVNNQWDKPTTRGKQPVPRYFHAAGLHRSNLIVFGGNEGEQPGRPARAEHRELDLVAAGSDWRAAIGAHRPQRHDGQPPLLRHWRRERRAEQHFQHA